MSEEDNDVAQFAEACRDIAQTMRADRDIFLKHARWIPIIFALYGFALTIVIIMVIFNTHDRLAKEIPAETAKQIHIEQNQRVTVEQKEGLFEEQFRKIQENKARGVQ